MDILECIWALYGNLVFMCDMIFVPKCHYANQEQTCPVCSDMHTGEWWWAVQVCDLLYTLVQALMSCVEVSQVVTTGSYSDPGDPIIGQNSGDPFLQQSCTSCLYYNQQHSKGNLGALPTH